MWYHIHMNEKFNPIGKIKKVVKIAGLVGLGSMALKGDNAQKPEQINKDDFNISVVDTSPNKPQEALHMVMPEKNSPAPKVKTPEKPDGPPDLEAELETQEVIDLLKSLAERRSNGEKLDGFDDLFNFLDAKYNVRADNGASFEKKFGLSYQDWIMQMLEKYYQPNIVPTDDDMFNEYNALYQGSGDEEFSQQTHYITPETLDSTIANLIIMAEVTPDSAAIEQSLFKVKLANGEYIKINGNKKFGIFELGEYESGKYRDLAMAIFSVYMKEYEKFQLEYAWSVKLAERKNDLSTEYASFGLDQEAQEKVAEALEIKKLGKGDGYDALLGYFEQRFDIKNKRSLYAFYVKYNLDPYGLVDFLIGLNEKR